MLNESLAEQISAKLARMDGFRAKFAAMRSAAGSFSPSWSSPRPRRHIGAAVRTLASWPWTWTSRWRRRDDPPSTVTLAGS